MTQHSLVAVIEPLEPVRVLRPGSAPDAIELYEIAPNMRLRSDEGNAALGEPAERVAPSGFRRGIDDVVSLRRMEIVALDPSGVRRPRSLPVGRDDPAFRR